MKKVTLPVRQWKAIARDTCALVVEQYYRLALRRLRRRGTAPVRRRPVIVSLSTTPKRLSHKTDVAIATLLMQKFRPDRVILWVSDAMQNQPLAKTYHDLIDAGLEVKYRKDVGPHTKLLYALQEYPDCVIVSADDDTFYPPAWLGDLYASYERAPQHIHAHRAHLMHKDAGGKLASYNEWQQYAPGMVGPSHLLFPTGVGGVLYPPNSLAQEVFNVEAFRRLCPRQDDVWFKAMALLQGTMCKKVKAHWRHSPPIHGSQEESLFATNVIRNDEQMHATFGEYDLYRLL